MALSELLEQLDPNTAAALRAAVDELRSEFRDQLLQTRRELGEGPAELQAEPLPEEPAAEAPVAEEVAPPVEEPDPLEELKHAVAQIDLATSQAEVLSALLEGARRFASRAALFLVHAESLEGWSGLGFEAADRPVEKTSLGRDPGTPWRAVAEGVGNVPLTGDACSALCDAVGAPVPRVGTVVPMMLGDRVAAALYADRLAGDGSLNLSALQLLTFCAGQSLETLPVRARSLTATLRVGAADAVAEEVGATRAIPMPPARPEPQPLPEPAAAEPDLPTAVELPAAEPPPVPEIEEEVTPTGFEAVPAEAEAPEPFAEPKVEPLAEPEVEPLVEPEVEPLAEPEVEPSVEGEEEVEVLEVEAPAEEPAPEPPPPAFTPEPPAEAPPPTGADQSSTLVQPPSDVAGPGWAFTGGQQDSEHEEARRLARLLVTEIKLYNEDQVEIGRQQGDLIERLREDIDRSRQIFNDRVPERVRNEKDYFQETLVRILAGGDASALGE